MVRYCYIFLLCTYILGISINSVISFNLQPTNTCGEFYRFFNLSLPKTGIWIGRLPPGGIIANYSHAIKRKLHRQHVPFHMQYCTDPLAGFATENNRRWTPVELLFEILKFLDWITLKRLPYFCSCR